MTLSVTPEARPTARTGARAFYEDLTANFRTEGEEVLHRFATDNAVVLDQVMTGTVVGSMLGIPGNGRRISFRTLHVFEFRDGWSAARTSGWTRPRSLRS
ncbi:MAG TPA: ester cyclase [Mycobacterium sp.]|nr:ester cyclase [Mycobacterium sp.]